MPAKKKWIAVAAVAIVLCCILAAWRNRRASQAYAIQASAQLDSIPIPFGYKTAWFAVHTSDAQAVAAALGLQGVRPSGWTPGLVQATGGDSGQVFVAPAVRGWVLAVGRALMLDPKYEDKVKQLSRQFGEAQFYVSMRVSGVYIWARASNGGVTCLFEGVDGRKPRREGLEDDLESVLRMRFTQDVPPGENDPSEKERMEAPFPDEQDVLRVAGVWSVNPAKMDQYPEAQYSGLIGRYPQ